MRAGRRSAGGGKGARKQRVREGQKLVRGVANVTGKRMRALVLAEQCNPEWASLPGVTARAVRGLARRVRVTLVTHVRNRPALEHDPLGTAELVFVDNEWLARPLHRMLTRLRGGSEGAWTLAVAGSYLPYLAFEHAAWRLLRPRMGEFDVVHRLSPMSPTIPSPFSVWCSLPFVLGPLNGGLPWPRGYEAELRREREWLTYVRGAYRLLPYVRRTYRGARAILAAFEHTIHDLPASVRSKIVNFPEVGVDPTVFNGDPQRQLERGRPVRLLFVGRLVPYKRPTAAVAALASEPALRRAELWIVGDGPERPALEHLVRTHRLEGSVRFLGWRSHEQVASLMRQADVFVFPSIRELGAGVVAEAMASACVPVVMDYGGPAELVTEGTGVKLPLRGPDEQIQDLAQSLRELVADAERRFELARAARERAHRFLTWDVKAEKTLEVYRWVLGERATPPDFWAEQA